MTGLELPPDCAYASQARTTGRVHAELICESMAEAPSPVMDDL